MIMYEERVLAYIDVLGFTNAVNNTVDKKTGKEIGYNIEKIDDLLDEVQYQRKIKEILKELQVKDRVTSQFSDSIVISYSKENYIHHIFQDIYFLCVMALEKGFLFRGGITCGKVIHTKEKIFGPAFLKAYDMEKKQACFPRVIIDDNIFDIAKTNYSKCSNPDAEYNGLMKLVLCDADGKYFINYIDKLYTGVDVGSKGEQDHLLWLEERIRDLEKKIKGNTSLYKKYLWLKKWYNVSFDKYKKKFCNE